MRAKEASPERPTDKFLLDFVRKDGSETERLERKRGELFKNVKISRDLQNHGPKKFIVLGVNQEIGKQRPATTVFRREKHAP